MKKEEYKNLPITEREALVFMALINNVDATERFLHQASRLNERFSPAIQAWEEAKGEDGGYKLWKRIDNLFGLFDKNYHIDQEAPFSFKNGHKCTHKDGGYEIGCKVFSAEKLAFWLFNLVSIFIISIGIYALVEGLVDQRNLVISLIMSVIVSVITTSWSIKKINKSL